MTKKSQQTPRKPFKKPISIVVALKINKAITTTLTDRRILRSQHFDM